MASPLRLSRPGVWQPDLKPFPHKHHPGWGGAAGAVSGGPARLTQCLREGWVPWVWTRVESTPLGVLGKSLLALGNGGLGQKLWGLGSLCWRGRPICKGRSHGPLGGTAAASHPWVLNTREEGTPRALPPED